MNEKPLVGVLIASDIDGTITSNDTIFDLFEKFGLKEEAERINATAPGEDINLVLDKIAKENVLTREDFNSVADSAVLFPEAGAFYQQLEQLGAKVLLLSATYEPIAVRIASRLGLTNATACATQLKWTGNRVTGCGLVVELQEKEKILKKVAVENKFALSKTVGIADSPNDKPFMDLINEQKGLCIWVDSLKQPDYEKMKQIILQFIGEK